MAALVHFDRSGQWGETLVCEQRIRDRLKPHGVVVGQAKPDGSVPYPRKLRGAAIHRLREGTRLYYVAEANGWLGLLWEAGEWVAVLPGASARLADAPPDPQLPGLDRFVEALLALSGDELHDG